MRHYGILLVLVASFFFSGSLGFRTPSDCQPYIGDNTKLGELSLCYHEAAISLATINAEGNSIEAARLCDKIGSLNIETAEAQRNKCMGDIAEIIGGDDGEAICMQIKQSDIGSAIQGASVTQDICMERARRSIAANNYKCRIAFLFPLLPISGFLIRKYQQRQNP